jgi:DNA (cytosine-5)-methyltransferase 1
MRNLLAIAEETELEAPREAALSSVELFAGAGGLALGLTRAGFRPRLLIERDARAVATLTANSQAHGRNWTVKRADVGELAFSEYDGVDLLSAGPPCQPFSIGGLRLGSEDDRDGLPATIRAIRESKPRAFLIENVRGLTFPAAKDYFDYILAQLRDPGIATGSSEADHRAALAAVPEGGHEYEVHHALLNAADYGAPQQRVRLLIVGLRAPLTGWRWPKPTHGRRALLDALAGDGYWERHGVEAAVRDRHRADVARIRATLRGDSGGALSWRTTRDVLLLLADAGRGDDPHHKIVEGARLYPRHRGSLLDWPAKTVKAGVHGTPGGEHIVLLDNGTHRYFTVRECAALQGFPDDYALPEVRSVALRQIGNAVPVQLAEAVGRTIGELLGKGD